MDIRKTIKKVLAASDRALGKDPLERHNWYGGHQLHKPARLDDETQEQYRARRRRSALVAKAMQRPPQQEPAKTVLDHSRFWLGRHTNKPASPWRKAKKFVGFRQARKIRAVVRREEGGLA